MESLPPELLAKIIGYLEDENHNKLSPYAGISASWQTAIERHTFRTLHVTLLCKSLDRLCEVLLAGNARRVQYVRTLIVDLGTGSFDPNIQPREYAKIDERRWTAAMTRLLVPVAKALEHVKQPPSLHLHFCERTYVSTIDDWESLSRDMPTTIPQVNHVSSMDMNTRSRFAHINSTDFLALTDSLPDLTNCSINICDAFSWGRRRRIKDRKAIADSIIERSFNKVHNLTLKGHYFDHQHETYDPPDLTSADDGVDTFTRVLRHLTISPQMTTLNLTGCHVISYRFFRDLPPFPVLSTFELNFSASSAEGKWFFVADEDLIAKIRELDEQQSLHQYDSDSSHEPIELWDSEDEDGPLLEDSDGSNHFRTLPNPETIPHFLVDAANMVASTPCLRKFILRHTTGSSRDQPNWADNELIPYGRHMEVCYLRSGTSYDSENRQIPSDKHFLSSDRMYWRVGERWRPDANIIKTWQHAVGPDVKYCFLKEIYDTQGLSMTWQPDLGDDRAHYTLDLEWEEPGQVIDLELGKLKQPYRRSNWVFGPWDEEHANTYSWMKASDPESPLPEGWIE